MSLSTMRRRNSRPRDGDGQHGAPQREEQARDPPTRRGGTRLEIAEADRRLDALLEEERGRAASLPAQPGVKRLEIAGGRAQSSQQGLQEALNDPRAEAMGLGALQDAFRHSFGLLQQLVDVRFLLSKGYLDHYLGATIREPICRRRRTFGTSRRPGCKWFSTTRRCEDSWNWAVWSAWGGAAGFGSVWNSYSRCWSWSEPFLE